MIVSIYGELSEIGRVAMMAGADEISDEMKQALENRFVKNAKETDKN